MFFGFLTRLWQSKEVLAIGLMAGYVTAELTEVVR